MSETASFQLLLKNIQNGLRVYSADDFLNQLNQRVIDLLNSKDDKQKYVDFALKLVCDEYGISKRILINSTARGKFQQARIMAYCLLHHELGLPARYIAKRIFDKWHNSILDGLRYFKTIDMSIKEQKQFHEVYIRLQEKLISTIKTQL